MGSVHAASRASAASGREPPTLLTRLSVCSACAFSAALIEATAVGSSNSTAMRTACDGARASIPVASDSRSSSRRATTATRAPSMDNSMAVARPMPLLAPVTSATFPAVRNSWLLRDARTSPLSEAAFHIFEAPTNQIFCGPGIRPTNGPPRTPEPGCASPPPPSADRRRLHAAPSRGMPASSAAP